MGKERPQRPTENNPREEVTIEKATYNISYITTPERLKLLQEAGRQVGLEVDRARIILSDTGRMIPMHEGEIGVRYITSDPDLLDRFNKKVAELTAAQQQPQ
jgi:hypothetical protein